MESGVGQGMCGELAILLSRSDCWCGLFGCSGLLFLSRWARQSDTYQIVFRWRRHLDGIQHRTGHHAEHQATLGFRYAKLGRNVWVELKLSNEKTANMRSLMYPVHQVMLLGKSVEYVGGVARNAGIMRRRANTRPSE